MIFLPASLGLLFPALGRPCRAAELVCVRAMAAFDDPRTQFVGPCIKIVQMGGSGKLCDALVRGTITSGCKSDRVALNAPAACAMAYGGL